MELTPESASDYYDHLIEGSAGAAYKLWFEHLGKSFARSLLACNELNAGDMILDVGSATGDFLFETVRRLKPSNVVYGVDVSDAMLRCSAERSRFFGLEGRVRILRADLLELPFQDNSFDVVTAFGLLKHLDDGRLPRLLSEVYRVLKPGGKAIVAELGPAHIPKLDRASERHLRAKLRDRDELSAFLAGAGFSEVRPLPRAVSWIPPFTSKMILRATLPVSEFI